MPMQNPFIQRGLPLSELIANARAVQFEGNSPFTNLLNRNRLGQINQAIDRFGRRMPMQQPMQRPMPQPVQRPMPRPMQPMPQPMPAAPGVMGSMPSGTSPTVTVSGGGWGARPPAAQPTPWNALGLGGMIPGMGGQRGFGYGGYGGFGSFGGFSAAQPYLGLWGGLTPARFG